MIMESKTTIAIPPGETMKELLDDRNMSQEEFAKQMNMSEDQIRTLLDGEMVLTSDIAERLAIVLGASARFWSNLENIYRERIDKVQKENRMDADLKLLKEFPYNAMAKNGWVAETRKYRERVINLRKYFEVEYLELVSNTAFQNIACRKLGNGKTGDYALLSWVQEAKLKARTIHTNAIDIVKLKHSISDIKKMTFQSPEVFFPSLHNILASCGIALVILPQIKGSFLYGATFYDGDKIVIGMTIRGKYADRFWFSLFHEFGHIILGHINQSGGTSEEDEDDADTFAKDTLIPSEKYSTFVKSRKFDRASIVDFAKRVDIDPGILVGRLQKEGFIAYNRFVDLKTKFEDVKLDCAI